jgi:hypothetical protein
MATDFWLAQDDVYDTVRMLIAQHHPDLVLCEGEIAIVFREKAGKSGGQAVLGTSRKVAPLVNALSDKTYRFVLELAADVWQNELTAKQREALLDHLLCMCRCEEDPKSGEAKYSVAKPDFSAFRENLERYGMWFPKEEAETPSPVDEMFAADED